MNKLIDSFKLNEENARMLLIEHDAGFVDSKLNQNLITESFDIKLNEPVLVNCILQKWGVKNKNGRIYPKDVLISQINAYQELINGNSGLGECFTPDTKIMTNEGWKLIKNIKGDEKVLTLNRGLNQTEFQEITEKIHEDYVGDIYHIKSNNIDVKVTPNHRFLIENYKGELLEVRAFDLFDDHENSPYFNGKYKLIKKFNWIGEDNDFKFDDVVIKSKDFYAFIGIYLSEGCTLKGDLIQITQKNKIVIDKIESLLNDMKIDYKINIRKGQTHDFFIKNNQLFNYLKKLGKSHEKYIPNEIKNGTPELLNILLNWFLIGDGRNINYIQKNGTENNRKSIFSTSKKLIYDLNEILYKSGRSGNITIDTKRNDRIIVDEKYTIVNGEETVLKKDRIIKRVNSRALFTLNFSKTKNIYLDKRTIKVEKIQYKGNIVCVKVPNETIFVMRNGKALWTLNSDHPDSSIISLLNISHMITKMWWGNGEFENVLYGQLKLIVSPGYIKHGIVSVVGDKILLYIQNNIRLGISSRGVGSLKEINGENVVQDDYELIGFDLVWTPSTPGAYLFPAKKGDLPANNKKDMSFLSVNEERIYNATNKFLL